MKNVSVYCLVLLLLACAQEEEKALDMEGAYSLTKQILNDGSEDSVLDRGQLKIYSKGYMMYASPNLTDSFANFGIGKYRIEDGKVIEEVFYRAITGDTSETVVLNIEKQGGGYRQVIDQISIQGKNYKLTEDYDEVSNDVTTPLDGAWKQTRNVYVTSAGDSSVNTNPLEYKIYGSGHFIWGITAPDSLNNPVSVYGYGTFVMDGENKSKETVRSSTFQSGLVGKTYEVDIRFTGNDVYQQTITFANGDKSTETYQRLK